MAEHTAITATTIGQPGSTMMLLYLNFISITITMKSKRLDQFISLEYLRHCHFFRTWYNTKKSLSTSKYIHGYSTV